MIPPNDWYYTVQPHKKEVSKEEFDEYINNYPRTLVFDACGISVPSALSWNDFELADRWPYSVVANTWYYDMFNDIPEYRIPEEERVYYIVDNIEEVFASKTGRTVEDWREYGRKNQQDV